MDFQKWLDVGQVIEALKVMRDRVLWKDMTDNSENRGTLLIQVNVDV